jgi:hypothetical protein
MHWRSQTWCGEKQFIGMAQPRAMFPKFERFWSLVAMEPPLSIARITLGNLSSFFNCKSTRSSSSHDFGRCSSCFYLPFQVRKRSILMHMRSMPEGQLRYKDSAEELREEIDLTDQEEIAKGRRVQDRDHLREASRIAAISFSRSSIE